MAGRECGKRLSHTGKQLDLVLIDGGGEFEDTLMLLVRKGRAGELFEASDQRSPKAKKAISMCSDRGMLTVIEMFTDFGGRMTLVVEIRDERGDCSLEVDVIFPERIVSINQQSVARGTS